MATRAPGQVWWQAEDGRWYPPASHPNHEWSGRPVHVRTGCGGLLTTVAVTFVLAVVLLGSGHLGLLLLLVPLVMVFAAVSILRMIGRSILLLSKISDTAWQDAQRHAQERLAEQLRFFEAQRSATGHFEGGGHRTGGPDASQGRPAPPGPARDTVEWARSTLGVRPAATPVEVRKAFRQASKRWHPDLFMQATPGDRADAARHMEDVNAAHAILTGSSR